MIDTEGAERRGAVAARVVREDALDADAEALEALDQVAQEARGASGALLRMDFGVRKARAVIDSDERGLPARSPAAATAIAMDAMPDPLDATEPFRIDVDQSARPLVLIVARWAGFGLDPPELAEADP